VSLTQGICIMAVVFNQNRLLGYECGVIGSIGAAIGLATGINPLVSASTMLLIKLVNLCSDRYFEKIYQQYHIHYLNGTRRKDDSSVSFPSVINFTTQTASFLGPIGGIHYLAKLLGYSTNFFAFFFATKYTLQVGNFLAAHAYAYMEKLPCTRNFS
jgi:hypothetical protein